MANNKNLKPTNRKAPVKEDIAKTTVEETEDLAETSVVETETTEEITIDVSKEVAEKTEPKKNDTLVKVCLSKDHTCTIGGETYHFKKGVVESVPPNVKAVLRRGDLLRPVE